jgi:hypothetical protein
MVVESGLLALNSYENRCENSYENRFYHFVAEDKKRYLASFYRSQLCSYTKFVTTSKIRNIHVIVPLTNNK